MEFKAFASDSAMMEERDSVYSALIVGATVLFRQRPRNQPVTAIIENVFEEAENFKTIYTDKGSFRFSRVSCCYSAAEVGIILTD